LAILQKKTAKLSQTRKGTICQTGGSEENGVGNLAGQMIEGGLLKTNQLEPADRTSLGSGN